MILVCYNKSMLLVDCINCGKKHSRYPSHINKMGNNYCSKKCYAESKIGKQLPLTSPINNHAENNPNWNGGRRYFQGYILIRTGYREYKREHRLIMEKVIGRELRGDEVVHHINGIKDDNRIENLEIMSKSEHQKHHHPKLFKKCNNCGATNVKNGNRYLCFNCYQNKRNNNEL